MDNIQPRLGFAWQAERTDGHARRVRGCTTAMRWRRSVVRDRQRADRRHPVRQRRPRRISPRTRPTGSRCRPTIRRCTRFCVTTTATGPGASSATSCRSSCGPFEFVNLPRTFQTSIGFQRQFGNTMSFEVDYVYSKGRDEKDVVDNINLTFNPATGANYPVVEPGPASLSRLGRRLDEHAPRALGISRVADRLHQAVQQSLAGVGHVYALGPLERRHEAVQRSRAGPVRHRSRSGR